MSDQAERDENDVPSMLAVSNMDEESTVALYADPVLHALIITES
jgi:hypothetical protein